MGIIFFDQTTYLFMRCFGYVKKVSSVEYVPCPIFSRVLVVDSEGLLFSLNKDFKQRPSWLFGKAEKISILDEETGMRCPTLWHSSQ